MFFAEFELRAFGPGVSGLTEDALGQHVALDFRGAPADGGGARPQPAQGPFAAVGRVVGTPVEDGELAAQIQRQLVQILFDMLTEQL